MEVSTARRVSDSVCRQHETALLPDWSLRRFVRKKKYYSAVEIAFVLKGSTSRLSSV